MGKTSTDASNLAYRPCVGLMIIDRRGQVWIGRRAGKEQLSGLAGEGSAGDGEEVPSAWWQMPQGGIDKGESPREAALRELFEETGIKPDRVEILAETSDWLTYDLPAPLIGKIWGGKYRGQKQKWFAMRFSGSDAEINITPDDPDAVEFDSWRWADVDELIALIVPFKRQVYVQVIAELGHLAGGETSG